MKTLLKNSLVLFLFPPFLLLLFIIVDLLFGGTNWYQNLSWALSIIFGDINNVGNFLIRLAVVCFIVFVIIKLSFQTLVVLFNGAKKAIGWILRKIFELISILLAKLTLLAFDIYDYLKTLHR